MYVVDEMYKLFVVNFILLISILIFQITFAFQTTATIRAVGIQCNADYSILLPKSESENINAN